MDQSERIRLEGSLLGAILEMRATSTPEELLSLICELSVDSMDVKLAWVGLTDQENMRVIPIASTEDKGYLKNIQIRYDDSPLGKGPTGTAIREKRTVIQQSIPTDPTYKPWREEAMKRGFVTSAAVPLIFGDVCLGALNLYSDQPNFFSEERLRIFQDFALHASVVLHEQRVREDQEKAYADLKNAIPHPLFLVQDDRVIEINEEFEKHYQGTQVQLKTKEISLEFIFPDESISEVKRIMQELESKSNLRVKRIIVSVRIDEEIRPKSLKVIQTVKNEKICYLCIMREPDHI